MYCIQTFRLCCSHIASRLDIVGDGLQESGNGEVEVQNKTVLEEFTASSATP